MERAAHRAFHHLARAEICAEVRAVGAQHLRASVRIAHDDHTATQKVEAFNDVRGGLFGEADGKPRLAEHAPEAFCFRLRSVCDPDCA